MDVRVVIEFALLGLGVGGLYALAALGLVLVYRGSGVINFASGAIGMTGTYLYWNLHDRDHWPFVAAFVPSVGLCAAIGLLVHVLVMRPLRNASVLARLLATLGILTSLEAAVALRYPSAVEIVRSSLPRSTVRLLGTTIGVDHLWLLAIALALTAGLSLVYRFTKFGLATSAVAENSVAAATLGLSPDVIAGANWAIGCSLAGVAGILLAPITGLDVTQLTLLVIPALAAAVVGNMTSFGLTLAAGLGVGVVESEVGRYVSATGWAEAVPFFIIILVLMLRGSATPGRAHVSIKLPKVGDGRLRPLPVALALGISLAGIRLLPPTWVDAETTTLAYAVVLVSVVLVTGLAGQISLAQMGAAGIGALVAADMVAHQRLPLPIAMGTGMLAALLIGFLLGLPALRTRGTTLAIATLGLSVAVDGLIFSSAWLTGGYRNEINVGTLRFLAVPVDAVGHPRNYAVLCLVSFVVVAIALTNLRRGRTGRRLLAVRANERAAMALGVNVAASKLYAFSVAGMIAGLGGILIALRDQAVLFTPFNAFSSVNMVGLSVIGGVGYAAGPLFGAPLQQGALGTSIGHALLGASIQKWLPLASGILLVVVLIRSPHGVAERVGRQVSAGWSRMAQRHRQGRRALRPAPATATGQGGPDGHWRVAPKTLHVEDLRVEFGGTTAVAGLSLDIAPGEVVGLIGPNGAGKTTFVDAVSGFVRPTSGRIVFDGKVVSGRGPRSRARLGIGRSFQSLELFEDMTILENILVASEPHRLRSYASDFVRPGRPALSEAAARTVADFGLQSDLGARPPELSYGRRRLVAIARSIAAEPSLLMLDEPAAGLSDRERDELSQSVRSAATDRGMGVLLIEHDVEFVMRTCDVVVALDFGVEIGRGTPSEIRASEKVIAAYLGSDHVPA